MIFNLWYSTCNENCDTFVILFALAFAGKHRSVVPHTVKLEQDSIVVESSIHGDCKITQCVMSRPSVCIVWCQPLWAGDDTSYPLHVPQELYFVCMLCGCCATGTWPLVEVCCCCLLKLLVK